MATKQEQLEAERRRRKERQKAQRLASGTRATSATTGRRGLTVSTEAPKLPEGFIPPTAGFQTTGGTRTTPLSPREFQELADREKAKRAEEEAERQRQVATGTFKFPAVTPPADERQAEAPKQQSITNAVRTESLGAGVFKVFDAAGNFEILTSKEFQALQEAKKSAALGADVPHIDATGAGVSPGGGGESRFGERAETGAQVGAPGIETAEAKAQRLLPAGAPAVAPLAISAPDIESRNIWASTFREGLIPGITQGGGAAIATGILGSIAAGAASGTAAAPLTAGLSIPIAAIGAGVLAFARAFYSSYKSNQKEEVSNVWQAFRGLKSGVTLIPQLVRMGALSPQQAIMNLEYAERRVEYYEATLRQKEADGDFIADISDYDGKMANLMEWQNLYLSGVRAQIETAIRVPGYIPQELYVPELEDVD
jgi:hypothetical protein|tara:strand:- start:5355 stop:6635 length:1281 start_codon:yes stop_codon:yes gene_type:complete